MCFNFGSVFSQTESKSLIKPFGIGLHIEQFKLNDLTDLTGSPANKIVLSISPSKSFRLEPEFGLRFSKTQPSNSSASIISVGLGALGMFQRNNLNLYGGLRFEFGRMKSTSQYSSGTTGVSRIMIGPAFGAEYYLGENFTFGGEVGLRYFSSASTVDPKPSEYKGASSSYLTTDTGLFVRFYF